MVSYLRDFVDLPLGVYPNLGYYTDRGWRFDTGVGGAEYAELALRWRAEGAQILGGCCGVRPEHIAAARERLDGTRAGHVRPEPVVVEDPPAAPWTDVRGRSLYPLPFPRLKVEAGVTAPGPASFMAWRHLFTEGIGAGRRCLDVGSGTGILGIQLARNGADHVHCLDIDERAVANTLANAFRNDVSDRVTAATVDLYPWVPAERYEVIVASLSRGRRSPTAGRIARPTTGAGCCSISCSASCPRRSPPKAWPSSCSCRSSRRSTRRRCSPGPACRRGWPTSPSSSSPATTTARSSSTSRRSATRITSTRAWSPTCWRSATSERLEQTEAALARLAEAGPVSEIVARAPVEAAAAAGLERVLLARVDGGQLVPESVYGGALPRSRSRSPIR